MIDTGYVRTMARYNRWQNRSLYGAADTLADAERREDRGAFFGSIHNTLAHLVWGDRMWMSRFDGWERPTLGPADGDGWEWDALKAERERQDAAILDWAGRVTEADLAGECRWYSGLMKADLTRPMGLVVAHFFNHQTHHRGQAHALLTALGATPEATDLGFMPDDV